mgnify:CR=1 FL=1
MVWPDWTIGERAARLSHGLYLPLVDALVLATALEAGARELWTTDADLARLDAAPARSHPSLFTHALDPTISQDEFFFWELTGYLILKGVMDPGWVRAANAAVDSVAHTSAASEELSGGAPGLAGGGVLSGRF